MRAEQEAAEKAAALSKLREEKALSLGAEPEKGPDVTRVMSFTLQEKNISLLLQSLSLYFKPGGILISACGLGFGAVSNRRT